MPWWESSRLCLDPETEYEVGFVAAFKPHFIGIPGVPKRHSVGLSPDPIHGRQCR